MTTQYIDVVNGSDTLATVSITGATRANPCVITSNSHGFGNGQWIRITGVSGMTQLNNNTYMTSNVAANTFELQDLNGNNINSSAYGIWSSGGTVTQWRKIPIAAITKANPAVVTAKKHGFSNGNLIIIEDVSGMIEVNNVCFAVANATTDTFELSGIDSSTYGAWSSGGTVTRPFYTVNTLESYRGTDISPQNSFWKNGDTVKIARTFKYSDITTGSGNIVFTKGSTSVTTSVDLRANLAVGDFIGLTTARLDGCIGDPTVTKPDIFYRIDTITSGLITLNTKYCQTTTTVATVNRLRIGTEVRATGAVSGDAITTVGTNVLYEGGYSFSSSGSISRDRDIGATAIKNGGTQDLYIWTVTDTNSILRYINCIGSNRGFQMIATSTNSTIEYCSSNTVTYYPFLCGGNNATFNNCTGVGNYSGYSSFQPSTGSVRSTFNNCYATGSKAQTYLYTSTTLQSFYNNCMADQERGFSLVATGCVAVNCLVEMSSGVGFNLGSGAKLDNCTTDGCYYGVYFPGQVGSQVIYGCTFKNSTYSGIYNYRADGLWIENCSFIGNVNDYYHEQNSRDVWFVNCVFDSPTVYALARENISGGIVHVWGCSIDSLSASKAFQIITGARYNIQLYNFQNSFGITGQYWANGYLLEDTENYRTVSPSLKLSYNSTISFMNKSMKISSAYVTGGTGKTFTYYIKRDSGAWSGTITPQLRLNGRLIKTGTDITSLSNNWDIQQTISATSGEITEDGELSLEFIYNANNIAIWIDDIEVT